MCLAIYKPKGILLGRKVLKRSWYANSDGGGFMYIQDKTLTIKKGYFQFDDFFKACKEVIENCNNPDMVIHFRIATHGKINTANTQPISVNSQKLAFVHNGILPILENTDIDSDSTLFGRNIIANLPKTWHKNPAILELISGYAMGSILIFMNSKGKIWFINEHEGTWNNKIFFSNDTFKKFKFFKHKKGKQQRLDFPRKNINFWNDDYKSNTMIAGQCDCGAYLYTAHEDRLGLCYACQEQIRVWNKEYQEGKISKQLEENKDN